MKIMLIALSGLMVSFHSLAQENPEARQAPQSAFSADELKPFTNTYRMLFNGEELGKAEMQLSVREDELYLLDHTDVPNYLIYETTVSVVDAKSIKPTKSFGGGLMGGKVFAIEYEFKDDTVTGYSNFPRTPSEPQGTIDINTKLPANTIDRSGAFILAQSMPFNGDAPYVFNWYNGFNNTIKEISMRVVSEEQVEVPFGTFNTYKVEMLGGEPSQILYITQSSPHMVVKIEIINLPWVYELVSRETHP